MLLGIVIAYFSYRQYYPSLAHPLSHRPFAPRYAPKEQRVSSTNLLNLDEDGPETTQGSKGKGPDIEAANDEDGSDSEELDHEMEGTLPRNKPFSLSRLWTASTHRLHVPAAIASDA